MIIPSWFLRDLYNVDPSYRAEAEGNLVVIIKDVDITMPLKDGRTAHVYGPRTIDVFEHANEAALERLRERKYIGRKMNVIENPMNELRWLKNMQDEAKKKKDQLAIDMMAEGLMKMHRFENTTTVVMPGGKDGK